MSLNKWVKAMRHRRERNRLKGHSLDWRNADRFIKNELAGRLVRFFNDMLAETVDDHSDDHDVRFRIHTVMVSFALCAFLVKLVKDNRRLLKRWDIKKGTETSFTFIDKIDDGMCGLHAWVSQCVWQVVKNPDEFDANMCIFALDDGKFRSHACVLHKGLVYSADLSAIYALTWEFNERLPDKSYRIAKVYDSMDASKYSNNFIGTAAVLDSDSDKGKFFARSLWFPWSTMRARRIADAIVKAYRLIDWEGRAKQEEEVSA